MIDISLLRHLFVVGMETAIFCSVFYFLATFFKESETNE